MKKGRRFLACLSFSAAGKRCLLLLGGSFFRSFEGVDLRIFGLDLDLAMGSNVAQPGGPLASGRRGGGTDFADGSLDNAIAADTILNDVLASIASESTALLGPEGTLGTGKYGLTLHG
jgi:hypothetical protein